MRDLDFSERKFGEVLILGGPYAFVYLVEDVLIDTGTAFWGKKISEYLREKGLKLRLVLLTHSHYDHVGGLPYILKSQNPQIFAHPYFEKVLSSEKALKLINELNKKEMELIGFHEDSYLFEPFEFLPLEDGQMIEFKEHTITVYYTPGHTRDSVTFLIEPEKIAIVGESAGVPNYKNTFILPQFLSSYSDYIKSLLFISTLEIEALGLPHELLIFGKENVAEYLKNSYETTLWYEKYLRGLIEKFGEDWEKIKENVVEDIYQKHGLRQPFHAFFTNLQAQISALKKE